MNQEDIERLKLRVRRCITLTPQSAPTARLLEVLNGSEPSCGLIEKAISADPTLAALILRSANTGPSHDQAPLSLLDAVARLGTKALRALALASMVHEITKGVSGLQESRFARHSLAVGFLSRYLFARKFRCGVELPESWSADELFAIGLLHDIGYPLLAKLDPDTFNRLSFFAKRNGCSVSDSFRRVSGCDLSVLSIELVKSWAHSEHLAKSLAHINTPWDCFEEYEAISCITFAEHLATHVLSNSIEEWQTKDACPEELLQEFNLSEQEISLVLTSPHLLSTLRI